MATTDPLVTITETMTTAMTEAAQVAPAGQTTRDKYILASNIVNTTGLVIIMFSMGCVIRLEDLKVTFRRPIGFFIGMASQFVLMPLLAFILALALRLDTGFALSMLILGCCPGGSSSNVFTHWTKGDTCLSVSMTTVSTAAAIGMMPLNLLIYTRYWTQDESVVPFLEIFISLVTITIPAFFGVLLCWYKPKIAQIINKIGSVFILILIICAFALVILINPTFYKASWGLWVGAALLPVLGFLIGYVFAFVLRQGHPQCRAIAFETGSQNAAVAFSITILSFARTSYFLDMIIYPVLYALFIYVDSFALLGVYWCYRKLHPSNEVEDEVKPETNGGVNPAFEPDVNEPADKISVVKLT